MSIYIYIPSLYGSYQQHFTSFHVIFIDYIIYIIDYVLHIYIYIYSYYQMITLLGLLQQNMCPVERSWTWTRDSALFIRRLGGDELTIQIAQFQLLGCMEVAGMLKWRNWLCINRGQNVVVVSNIFESGIRHVAFNQQDSAQTYANYCTVHDRHHHPRHHHHHHHHRRRQQNNQHPHPVHLPDDESRLIIFIITMNASGFWTGKT